MAGTVKAWIAAGASFLTALLTEWTNEANDKLTTRDLVVALLAALVTFGAVYSFPNRT